jgi:hypothetical protein
MKIERDQAVTQDGKARYRRTAPKYKKGEFIVRKITNHTRTPSKNVHGSTKFLLEFNQELFFQ